MEINKEAFEILKSSINKFNDWKGINAKEWGNYFNTNRLNEKLDAKLKRSELFDNNFIKDLNNEELAIAILSWGGNFLKLLLSIPTQLMEVIISQKPMLFLQIVE